MGKNNTKHRNHILTIVISCIAIIGLLTGCSTNNSESKSSTTSSSTSTVESTPATTTSTTVAVISEDKYYELAKDFSAKIDDASIYLSNMGQYEYNYMDHYTNISGNDIDSDTAKEVVDEARQWLVKKGKVKSNKIDNDYKTLTKEYNKLATLNISNSAKVVAEKVNDIYDNYSKLYSLVTNIGDFSSFADDYNDYIDNIDSYVSYIKTIAE